MASSLNSQQCFITEANKKEEEDKNKYKETYKKCTDMVPTLPKENGWITKYVLKYQNSWFTPNMIKGVMLVQDHFMALSTDILLATFPKSGTTWLKALIFTIMNRKTFHFSKHPLLSNSPQACIPFIEALILQNPNISSLSLPSPRLLSTHIPCTLLPPSVRSSGCQIVYLFRNPKDVFVSIWQYFQKLRPKELPPLSLEEGVDMFCKGIYQNGPLWDHALGYWNASLESPEKVLFLSFEDMKKDPFPGVKRLAEFLGQPFSLEEERDGIVEETIRLCSFENLSNLEVNKTGVHQYTPNIVIENHVFFRKGEVGDWKNHLTEEMVERLNQVTEQKFCGTGLMSHIST